MLPSLKITSQKSKTKPAHHKIFCSHEKFCIFKNRTEKSVTKQKCADKVCSIETFQGMYCRKTITF